MLIIFWIVVAILTTCLILVLIFGDPPPNTRIIKRGSMYCCQFKYPHLFGVEEWADMYDAKYSNYEDAEERIKEWYSSKDKTVSEFSNIEDFKND